MNTLSINYKTGQGLIHTVSYATAQYIQEQIGSLRFILQSSSNGKKEILEMLKGSQFPYIILSPSMDRGVDLADDLCRWTVIVKAPYPDLSDKRVSARLYCKDRELT